MRRLSWLVPSLYILFLMLPIYWLVSMSFKTTNEILGSFTLWPQKFTLENYQKIFTDPTWYSGYINSLIYVVTNTVISVTAALPAAYAFSRYRFLGDKHLFFWLLTNRMAPAAVFALPFFQLYRRSACSTRISPWRWRIACSTFRSRCGSWRASCRRAQAARRDGLSRRLRLLALLPPHLPADDRRGHRRGGLLLLHVLVGRAAAGQDADLGRRQADRRHHDPHRQQLGLRARPARRRRDAHHHSRARS